MGYIYFINLSKIQFVIQKSPSFGKEINEIFYKHYILCKNCVHVPIQKTPKTFALGVPNIKGKDSSSLLHYMCSG